MDRIRLKGVWATLAGVAIMAPAFWYLWLVDYRYAANPPWLTPLAVGFCSPAAYLVVRGCYAVLTGKELGRLPQIRL